MNIDLELYRIFCEVVKYKNISKAAENMYVSQPAVTQSIQKLENELGGKVFFRNKNGIELTEEGKNLYEYIKNSVETMKNAENIFSDFVNINKGKIRIGGSNSIVASIILKPLIEFMRKYPNIDVSINSGKTDELVQNLANGELDIVVLNLPYKSKYNIEVTPLRKLEYVFCASKEYLKENPIKELKEIENHNLIIPKKGSVKFSMLNEYCNEKNIKLNPKYEISSSSIIRDMVLNNAGIGFINTRKIENFKKEIEIIEKIEIKGTHEGIATLNKNMCSKATIELTKEIKEYYKQNL